ncbi:hypothetical protein NP493_1444g00002 [Ridgeia piscesae]|uniref:Uncharacterized protein n=1 Tax=Ridgeia piscesae TaxID=27915 RepID=A0AAD9K2Q8_RIDPI|nr:hypothetical protein NP493_1444g00002 [Ridgeia piscesae]
MHSYTYVYIHRPTHVDT